MKVLFVCYPHVGIVQGGMYQQINNTANELRNLGVDVVYHDVWSNQLDDIDICHVFSTHVAIEGLFNAVVKKNIPVVWSTVLNVFDKTKLRLLTEKILSKYIPGFLPNYKQCGRFSRYSSSIIALNKDEKKILEMLYPESRMKIFTIPNGIDARLTASDKICHKKLEAIIKNDNPIVLNVAYFCHRKNQLNLIRSSKGRNWNLVLIGKIDDSEYSKQCLIEAEKIPNVFILGELPYGDDLLLSSYQKASVFALPSFSEVQPLTLIEAAQNDCNLVVSNNTPVQSFLNGYVSSCDPSKEMDISAAINCELAMKRSLKTVISKQPSWCEVSNKVMEIYRNIVA